VTLFGVVSSADMRAAQIVTGATMAAFIIVGLVPGLREHAGVIRVGLLVIYLLVCAVFVAYVLMR
jgi:hypothetical protein